MIILKNCRLVPYLTEGYEQPTADIFIEKKKIQGIYPCGTQPCGDAEVYDLKGKTVLPGFFDLHAHLMFSHQNWEYLMHRNESTYVMDCAAYAKAYLKLGYTTIRDAGNDYYASVTVRDNINRGVLTGARVITSGKILTPTTRGNSSFGELYKEIDGVDAMLKACRQESAAGVDFIKYMCTGAVLNLGGEPGQMVTSPAELRAVAEAAESLGTYVAAHCHGTTGIKEAIKAGIRTIEHASYMDEECIDMILKQGNVVSTVPTFAVAYSLATELSGPQLAEFKAKGADAVAHMAKSLRLCQEGGVLAGFGTDLDMENALKYPGIEFRARADYGFDNESILKQATIESAKILQVDDALGTICVGKLADLVVMDGAPDEDIACIEQYPFMVWKEGVLFRG